MLAHSGAATPRSQAGADPQQRNHNAVRAVEDNS